jgi:hypothetical protein
MEDLASFQVQLPTTGGDGYGHYGHVSAVSSFIWNTKHGIRTARDSLQLLAKFLSRDFAKWPAALSRVILQQK